MRRLPSQICNRYRNVVSLEPTFYARRDEEPQGSKQGCIIFCTSESAGPNVLSSTEYIGGLSKVRQICTDIWRTEGSTSTSTIVVVLVVGSDFGEYQFTEVRGRCLAFIINSKVSKAT